MKPKPIRIFRRFLALTLAILLSTTIGFSSSAVGGTEGKNGAFKEFERALNGSYFLKRDNYSLDMVETGITDMMPTMGNFVANTLFGLVKITVEVSCTIYYLCTELNVVELFKDDINNVQTKLKDGIFDGVYLLAFSFVALYLLVLLFKQNTPEILSQLVKFLTILVITSFIFDNTTTVITFIDDFVKGINNIVTSAIYVDNTSGSSNEAKTVDSMWDMMLHKPWETLEFMGGKEGYSSHVDEILSTTPNSEQRQKLIEEISNNKKDPNFFSKSNPGSQIPLLIFYLIPCVARCLIYVAFGVMQLGFRLVTILLAYMGILIMTLALFPQLGGTRLITRWCRKIVQINLNIVMINFLLAFTLMVSSKLYTSVSNGWGWLFAILLDSTLTYCIFTFREKLMELLKFANKALTSPRYLETKTSKAVNSIDHTAKDVLDSTLQTVSLSDITAKDLGMTKRGAREPTVLRPDEVLFDDNFQNRSGYAHSSSAKEDIIIERPQLYTSAPQVNTNVSEQHSKTEVTRPMLADISKTVPKHSPLTTNSSPGSGFAQQSSLSKEHIHSERNQPYSVMEEYNSLPEDADRYQAIDRPQLEEKPTSSHIRFADEQQSSTAELTDTVKMTVPVIDEVAANMQHLDTPEPNRSIQNLTTDQKAARPVLDTPTEQGIGLSMKTSKSTDSSPTQKEAPILTDLPEQKTEKPPIQLSDRTDGNMITEQPQVTVRPRLEAIKNESVQPVDVSTGEQQPNKVFSQSIKARKKTTNKFSTLDALEEKLSESQDKENTQKSINLTTLT